jgi:hypothetical protein
MVTSVRPHIQQFNAVLFEKLSNWSTNSQPVANTEVHYYPIHNSPPLAPILNQTNPVYTLLLADLYIHSPIRLHDVVLN